MTSLAIDAGQKNRRKSLPCVASIINLIAISTKQYFASDTTLAYITVLEKWNENFDDYLSWRFIIRH